jgi:hypothetical protein
MAQKAGSVFMVVKKAGLFISVRSKQAIEDEQ